MKNKLLPDFPRTLHLPYKPNAVRDDLIATDLEVAQIFSSEHTDVTEKIDASNSGMALYNGNPVIRNRSQILGKGHNKQTTAKAQFSSVFNWFYKNAEKFEKINESLGVTAGVYGEWTFALHGIVYTELPSLFMAFDLYDTEREEYVDPGLARKLLTEAGFDMVPLLWRGPVESYEQLEAFCQEQSPFADERREGVYVKVSDGRKVTKRLKMVRTDFIQGCHWGKNKLTRNGIVDSDGSPHETRGHSV